MNNWILARGRQAEQALADVVPAGVRVIALPGAATHFASPQSLFIAEADGTEAEWLGRVIQATPTAVAFSRPPRTSRNAGARIWRPAASLEFPPEAARPAQCATHTGTTTERTPDGDGFAIQTALPLTELRLVFDDLAASAEEALIAWLAAQTRWGLDPFTLVDPAGTPATVRLANEPIRRERDAAGRRRLTLSLTVVQEGAYP